MPDWVLDDDKWKKAMKIAEEEHKDDYAYITGIYKKMGGKIKKQESLFIMAERIGKITGENKLKVLKSITSQKENINYARSKILSEKLDNFREKYYQFRDDKDTLYEVKADSIQEAKYKISREHKIKMDELKLI